MKTITLQAVPACSDNVGPYGSLVSTDGVEPTTQADTFRFWDALVVHRETRGLSLGVVEVRPAPYRGVTFERHNTSVEVLVPLDGEIILVLGAPTESGLPSLERFAAFRLEAGNALVLHAGTWHYAPVAMASAARVLVVYGAGTAENDKDLVQIDSALEAEIVLPEGKR